MIDILPSLVLVIPFFCFVILICFLISLTKTIQAISAKLDVLISEIKK